MHSVVLVMFLCFGAIDSGTVTVFEDNNQFSTLWTHPSNSWIPPSPFTKDEQKRINLLKEFKDFGVPSDIQLAYLPEAKEAFNRGNVNTGPSEQHESVTSNFDPWSIVWYIGSFGGLIAFFLVVSCSEWCCARGRGTNNGTATATGPASAISPRTRHNTTTASQGAGTPPPAYHLFAPPPYDTIGYEEKTDKFDVYVVPVHTMSVDFVENHQDSANHTTETSPPEYSSIDMPPT